MAAIPGERLTEADRRRLAPFVTGLDSPVYALRNLPEEVVAVLFAYYSRSRETLRENLLKLLNEGDLDLDSAGPPEAEGERLAQAREKARAFHEKWVLGYGHSSVAEHAVVHVAVEGISILAGKVVEDARLASFTEKSTRYVPFDTRAFHTPVPFAGTPAGAAYSEGIRALMETYDRLMDPLCRHIAGTHPRQEGQSEKAHQAACRAQACDVLRYLLPAATHTNIGMTVNARVLEGLLVRMLSHPLEEVRTFGAAIKEESRKIVPTLLKYAEPSEYRTWLLAGAPPVLAALAPGSGTFEAPESAAPPPRVALVRFDPDAEERVLTALLVDGTGLPHAEAAARAEAMDPPRRKALLEELLARRGRHEAPPRALEHTDYLFEVVVDFGAYRDIQRHRMATQLTQPLGFDLGWERPAGLDAAGLAGDFERAVEGAARSHRDLVSDFPWEAQYVAPLACRKRLLLRMNLRELHHFVSLRSARQGHQSYRRVAQEMYRLVAGVHPRLAAGIAVDLSDYDLSRG